MPNRYSHAIVLANYEALGLLNFGHDWRPAYKKSAPTAAPEKVPNPSTRRATSVRNTPRRPRGPSRLERWSIDYTMNATTRTRTPSPSTDSSTQTAVPGRYAESSNTSNPPSLVHSRDNSETKTVVSFYSGSSTSRPASSIVTQIYAPWVPPSPSQGSLRETNPSSSPSTVYSPLSLNRRSILLEPPGESHPEQTPCPSVPAPLRPAPLPTAAREPSLDLDCLFSASPVNKPAGSIGQISLVPQKSPSRKTSEVTAGRLYLDLCEPAASAGIEEPHSGAGAGPARSISPASLTTVDESLEDDDSELYFGSADESSEDESSDENPSSSSSPTSLQSIDHIAPWENNRLPIARPGHLQQALGSRATSEPRSSSSSIRGYSPDDAAPPPIARVRKVDLSIFPDEPEPTRRSFSIARHLGALRPGFSSSFKRTFSFAGRLPASQKSSSPFTLFGRSKKPDAKAQQELDLVARSVPYDYAIPAITPIMTENAASLLPPSSKALQASLRKRASRKDIGSGLDGNLVATSMPYEKTTQASQPIMTADPTSLLPPSSKALQTSLRKRVSKLSLRRITSHRDLGASSVPYQRAVQATMPVPTTDARDLMPVGTGWRGTRVVLG